MVEFDWDLNQSYDTETQDQTWVHDWCYFIDKWKSYL